MDDEKIYKIVNLGKQNDYVYDIEKETHDFNCGFPLRVSNTDSFVLSVKRKDIIRDLKNLRDLFGFSKINENRELFAIKNKKLIGKKTS